MPRTNLTYSHSPSLRATLSQAHVPTFDLPHVLRTNHTDPRLPSLHATLPQAHIPIVDLLYVLHTKLTYATRTTSTTT
ncbi:hypothetical protein Pcinc_008287 [Petrolisthes cinctipes]|uniref:Uncharacterized protein n=1 Tax=Petrolisthes cinctipes TaxID=88211 RepID=A0AAE1G9H3_PETCI|nr:hypothetical protein Pcinc_008287 [Petrolisthes cinctipes]